MTLTSQQRFAIRPATRADAEHLVQFTLSASKGLSLITWEAAKRPGETALEAGLRRARDGTGGFSYHKADMAEMDGAVVAGIVSYPIAPEGPTDVSDIPEVFRPLVLLEDRAGASWYINILATYEEARGQGAATALMQHVAARAKAAGQSRISIIVDAVNPAMGLYTHLGFEELSRMPFGRTEDKGSEGHWVLMVKPL
ncbi:GNAT family N-acetyltransferase [Roseobacter sinensis]|uniref:GNAT family N-acetyltransferase n=1 Tax=Roseobacter sinensis TaxID=2931391 RepID=A0ABT3BER5_9RHOB|nr:GNAT family N-acetyltransferase [Roseobacter sp. WL0113]MCV3272045.1 GNAT family N-acetyltransferase [Roseobacter sp. WL0113]